MQHTDENGIFNEFGISGDCGIWINFSGGDLYTVYPLENDLNTVFEFGETDYNFGFNFSVILGTGINIDHVDWRVYLPDGTYLDQILDTQTLTYSFNTLDIGNILDDSSRVYVQVDVTDLCGYTTANTWYIDFTCERLQVGGEVFRYNDTHGMWYVTNGSFQWRGLNYPINRTFDFNTSEGCGTVYIYDHDTNGTGTWIYRSDSELCIDEDTELVYTIFHGDRLRYDLRTCLYDNNTGSGLRNETVFLCEDYYCDFKRYFNITNRTGCVIFENLPDNEDYYLLWDGKPPDKQCYIRTWDDREINCIYHILELNNNLFLNITVSNITDKFNTYWAVYEGSGYVGLEDAKVDCIDKAGLTDEYGNLELALTEGLNYTCNISKEFYFSEIVRITTLSESNNEFIVNLYPVSELFYVRILVEEEIDRDTDTGHNYLSIGNIELQIRNLDTGWTDREISNNNGMILYDLPEGNYEITVIEPGYTLVRDRSNNRVHISERTDLRITIRETNILTEIFDVFDLRDQESFTNWLNQYIFMLFGVLLLVMVITSIVIRVKKAFG